jgi:hypothetical protein
LSAGNSAAISFEMQEESALTARAVIATPGAPIAARGYPRRVWDHWKQIAHAVGVVQTRFFMLIMYGIVVVPTGLLMRLGRDPLHLREPASGNWTDVRQTERSVDAARRQF